MLRNVTNTGTAKLPAQTIPTCKKITPQAAKVTSSENKEKKAV